MVSTVTNLLHLSHSHDEKAPYTLHISMKDSQTTESQEKPVWLCVIVFNTFSFLTKFLKNKLESFPNDHRKSDLPVLQKIIFYAVRSIHGNEMLFQLNRKHQLLVYIHVLIRWDAK